VGMKAASESFFVEGCFVLLQHDMPDITLIASLYRKKPCIGKYVAKNIYMACVHVYCEKQSRKV